MSARRTIVWVGGAVPHELAGLAHANRMHICECRIDEDAVNFGSAGFLLMEDSTADSFVEHARRLTHLALASGLYVGLITPAASSTDQLPTVPDHPVLVAANSRFSAIRAGHDFERVRVLYRDFSKVVAFVREQVVEPSANDLLTITGVTSLEHELHVLLARAFFDLAGIHVTLLSGGRSRARVWHIEPGPNDRDRVARPFVAKVHKRGAIAREQANAALVNNLTEPTWCAQLESNRVRDGSTMGLAVYSVARGRPLIADLPERFGPLLGALFEDTLRGLHGHREQRPCHLGECFSEGSQRLGVLRWSSSTVRQAASDAALLGGGGPSAPDTETLSALVDELPACPVHLSTIHGDLHVGNLIACGDRVVMIDFAAVLPSMPVVADLAQLEVSIAWPIGEEAGGNPLSLAARRALYVTPLPSIIPSAEAEFADAPLWALRSLQIIRRYAGEFEPDKLVYAVAVACNLIRYASYPDNGSQEDRAQAYLLASNLLINASRLLHAREN